MSQEKKGDVAVPSSNEQQQKQQHEISATATTQAATTTSTTQNQLLKKRPVVNESDKKDNSSKKSSDPPNKKRRKKKKWKDVVVIPQELPPFNDMLFKLLKFRAENKHCSVPIGHELYIWTMHLRRQYIKIQKDGNDPQQSAHPLDRNVLTKERMEVLDSIDFAWVAIRFDYVKNWHDNYNALIEFQMEHGHCSPTPKESVELNKWVKAQKRARAEYEQKQKAKKGEAEQQRQQQGGGNSTNNEKQEIKYIPLTPEERFEKLDELGIDWTIQELTIGWDARYQQLIEYKKETGHCNVPGRYKPNQPLASWVAKQRTEHTKKLLGERHCLSDEREARLNKIGFRWVAPGFKKRRIEGYCEDDHQQSVATGSEHYNDDDNDDDDDDDNDNNDDDNYDDDDDDDDGVEDIDVDNNYHNDHNFHQNRRIYQGQHNYRQQHEEMEAIDVAGILMHHGYR